MDRAVFAANLDRLMTRFGFSNAALGRNLGVSRQMIWSYRQGGILPSKEKLALLMQVFNCPRSAFTKKHSADPMLSLQRWAKREIIPYARAVELVRLGLLKGVVVTPHRVFVPPNVHAPDQSKRLVLLAKRRPQWVDAFTANFDAFMVLYGIENVEIARPLSVTSGAVAKWRSGASYPTVSKLAPIARMLGCSYDDLMLRAPSVRRTSVKTDRMAA